MQRRARGKGGERGEECDQGSMQICPCSWRSVGTARGNGPAPKPHPPPDVSSTSPVPTDSPLPRRAVYVGDSMTDVPALISADIGVLIGRNPLARRVAQAAGITLLPLDAVPLAQKQHDQSDGVAVIYEAPSWLDIQAFLFSGRFRTPGDGCAA